MSGFWRVSLLVLFALVSTGLVVQAQDCPLTDLTDDCRMDFGDLFVFGLQWLDIPGGSGNFDGTPGVDIGDFALLAADWGVHVPLVINEFMADNKDFYLDPAGEDDDWIEIYNYGDTDINMAGMYLSDDLAVPDMSIIPYGKGDATIVPAGGYLLIWADSDTGQAGIHATFGLGREGSEDVGLFDSNGNLVDSIADFGPQLENHSLGRFPNGETPLHVFGSSMGTSPTPGKANSIDPADDNIVISEIMYHPEHDSSITEPENIGEEYIELYNNGAAEINMQGWQFIDGIDFVFPFVTLDAGEYLVVAADLAAFQAKYPLVSNVVAGWTGHLSNSGERIRLSNFDGRLIDDVRYSDEGDWSQRYLVPVDRYGHRGWKWSDAHDGEGGSLELINIDASNEYGQSWIAGGDGGTPGEAYPAALSDTAPLILDVEHSPIIPKANETVVVTASVRDDLGVGPTVKLHWRVDASGYNQNTFPVYEPATYTVVYMYDNGTGGDRQAGDGVFSAEIGAHPEGTIIEFFIEAGDGVNVRTWPAPAEVDGGFEQVVNCLYQVYLTDSLFDPADDWTPGGQPLYNIIMTNSERSRIADIGDGSSERNSDVQMNATFISVDGVDTKLRYNCGVRNRGHGSRDDPPNNFRVNFRQDDSWKDVSAINLNDQYTYLQYFGHILFKLAGLPSEDPLVVQLRINGVNHAADYHSLTQGSYVQLEVYDTEWAGNHFPDDPDGNLYSAVSYSHGAELDFLGWDPALYNKPKDKYAKNSNSAAEEWSDLIEMTYVLDVGETSDEDFINEIDENINVDQWLRWFAINNLMTSSETNLGSGSGDDYFMYFGTEDRRCILLPHDQDSVLTRGGVNDSIWLDGKISSLPVIERFLEHPRFTGEYYGQFRDLFDTVFDSDNFNLTVDHFLDWVDPPIRSQIKSYVASRETNILSGGSPQIPASTFTIQTSLSESPSGSGYYRTTVANLGTAEVYGTADVFQTRSVTVNGITVDWDNINGDWSVAGSIPLNPGINRVEVEAFDDLNGVGNRLEKDYIDIWYDDSSESTISGAVATSTLDAASGPWHVTGNITVGSGVTLTIDPGTTLFFDAGVGITVNTGGRLVAEGTQYERIMLTRVPGGTSRWGGIVLASTLADNRLCYVDMEYGDNQAQSVDIDYSKLLIDNMSWNVTSKNTLEVNHPSLIVQNSVFPAHDGEESIHGVYLTGAEYLIIKGNTFGRPSGYQDVIDFSHCNRPGPILQVYDNVFLGGGDDALDLDDTDAHIEGNLFMDFASGRTGDDGNSTANAVATDADCNITLARNIFLGGDHHVLLKGDVHATAQNNVFVGATMSAINFGEPGRGVDPGEGAILEGNIFLDNAAVFHNIGNNPSYPGYGDGLLDEITVNNSIIPSEYVSLGSGNMEADPHFVDAQNDDYHLQSFSPAIGSGPLGLDMGVYVPAGASISGPNSLTTAMPDITYTIGGPGITHYKWRLDGGAWSLTEESVSTALALSSLAQGEHILEVIGKNSAGVWQEQADAAVRTWTVDSLHVALIISEVLSHSHAAAPDLIELYYDGPGTLDMAGMSITDNPGDPLKYVFGPGTTIAAGEYKVLIADPISTVPGHLNFALNSLGDEVYLYDAGENLIDSIDLGIQWRYWSVGRLGDDKWHLTVPTLGSPNIKQLLGDPAALKINEWLANGRVLFEDDFIELYNPGAYPVDLSNLYLTDNNTQPLKSCLGPLSVIEPNGYVVFRADDSDKSGHVNFKLNSTKGTISLADDQGNVIDRIVYRPQTTDYSQGRSPDGAETLAFFGLPTPWLPNTASGSESTSLELVAANADVVYEVPTDSTDEDTWMQSGYNNSGWQSDAGVLGFGEVFTGGASSSQWQAFNDCQITPLNGTQANVTTYSKYGNYSGSEGGPLKDFATGSDIGMPTVTFTSVGTLGTSTGGAAASPGSGTDAHTYFFEGPGNPIVDFSGNLMDLPNGSISLTITFTGLNPNATYNFVGSAFRTTSYPTRITLVTISGHDIAAANSSIGIATPTLDTALLQAGSNSSTGYVVGWTDIACGVDGSFAITCEVAPGGATKAYPINGFLLEQLTHVAGPLETEMVGDNASIYVRTEFDLVEDPADLSSLTLKMRYEDGFIAFLNGVEVASDNFGLTRAWNSQADSDRANGLASSYVEFDIFAFISNLVTGTNVLAIQGLNNIASDPNFLVQTQIEAVLTPESSADEFANAVKLMDGLRITELMYNPSVGAEYEFVELHNTGAGSFDISGVRFTDGIDFTFPASTELAAGGYVVLATDLTAFASRYPAVPAGIVFGPYDGRFNNGGENIVLALPEPFEAAILRFEYSDAWYPATDGDGYSLVIGDATDHRATWDDAESWQSSSSSGGSPGIP